MLKLHPLLLRSFIVSFLACVGRLCLMVAVLGSLYFLSGLLSLLESIGPSSSLRRAKAICTQRHLKLLVIVCGLRLHVEGRLPATEKPFLLLSNHASYWDVIALGSLLPMGFIAKREVKSWFLLGGLASRINTIFVQREDARSRSLALSELRAKCRDIAYCVFPEGTTTDQPAPDAKQWYRGQISLACRPGLAAYSVGLHYREHRRMAWIGDDSFFPHLLLSLRRRHIDVFLTFRALDLGAMDDRGLSRWVKESFEQTVAVSLSARDRAARGGGSLP